MVATASHPSASFSATIRVRLEDRPGSFGRLATAIGEAGGSLGAIDLVRVEGAAKVRDVTVEATDAAHIERIVEAVRAVDGVEVEQVSDRTFLLHLGGKLRVEPKIADQDARRPVHGLHARRGPDLPRDRRRPDQGLEPDRQAERGRRRHRRDGRPRPRRHRPGGGAARDGGQGGAVQGVRRRRRLADLPRDDRPGRDRRRRHRDRPGLRRHQPRGHLRAALLRDRGAAARDARHPRLPRRPARNGRRRARRTPERLAGRRQAARRLPRRRHRRRRGRRRDDEDAPGRRRPRRHRLRPPGRDPPRPPRALRREARVRGVDQSARPARLGGRRARGRRRLRRALRPGRGLRRRHRLHGRRRDRVRDGEPDARGRARGDRGARRGRRHRPFRLSEPDQQRPRVPRASSAERSTCALATSPRR